MYVVYRKDTKGNKHILKEYVYKEQAVIHCYIKGLVNSGRGYTFLDSNYGIEEV